ncbi:hypothetical protein ACWD4G_30290 [Streptomyces sp. NPDC002643]
MSYTPGTDALRRISPFLVQTQNLTAAALAHLTALDHSTYTALAGSRSGLELLASVVYSSSLAANDLANALMANPYEGAPFSGYPADDASSRAARHTEALPRMASHLQDAAHQLDLSATGCHYLAHSITDKLASSPGHKAASTQQTTGHHRLALTRSQYAALEALRDGGHLYENARRAGVTRVATDDGTRVSIATYEALRKRGLVTADTSTPLLYHGQKITVTEDGHRALKQPRPQATPPATTATAPQTIVAQGPRR